MGKLKWEDGSGKGGQYSTDLQIAHKKGVTFGVRDRILSGKIPMYAWLEGSVRPDISRYYQTKSSAKRGAQRLYNLLLRLSKEGDVMALESIADKLNAELQHTITCPECHTNAVVASRCPMCDQTGCIDCLPLHTLDGVEMCRLCIAEELGLEEVK